MSVAYIRLFNVLLARASSSRTEGGCLQDLLKGCVQLLQFEGTFPSPVDLFANLVAALSSTDTEETAVHILDSMSTLALLNDDSLLNRTVEASWASLHTIYANERSLAVSSDLPVAIYFLNGEKPRELCGSCRTCNKLFDFQLAYLSSTCTADPCGYLVSVIRHWGLLTSSAGVLGRFMGQLSALVDDLCSFVQSLHNKVTDQRTQDRTVSWLPFLSPATFGDVFSVILIAISCSLARSEPSTAPLVNDGPYHHLLSLACLFEQLLGLYEEKFIVFPRTAATQVMHAARFALVTSVSQLHRCAEWRSCQPLLPVHMRDVGEFDAGSHAYLRNLMDTFATCIIGRILSLCDFWQSSNGASHLSKGIKLRQAAERTVSLVKRFAISQNWTSPSFNLDDCPEAPDLGETRVLDIQSLAGVPLVKERPSRGSNGWQGVIETDDDNSENAFGVFGDWGEGIVDES
jgi:hypothetical protein